MALITSLMDHFDFLFAPLRHDNGRNFVADHIPHLAIDPMNRILQLQLWDFAIQNHAYHAYHNLAILTDDDFLFESLSIAVEFHEFWAILSLCARISRVNAGVLMPFISCNESCVNCANIRSLILNHLEIIYINHQGS